VTKTNIGLVWRIEKDFPRKWTQLGAGDSCL
jgi:hypothetical protein